MSIHEMPSAGKGRERKGSLILWLLVCGVSLAFAIYGLIIFLVIGDKGVPAWDFGVVEDTPGKSEYSTFSGNGMAVPEEQHVAGRPSRADAFQGEHQQ
ncbi:MAG: hypothetical protein A4E57_02336 [Syntrophorhabdaceae bacterium PtaU1.Bin034]|nr:MAG: hypothetical protein A4E57_02336 [Syntrophorhabdaceae bacterium PtaU1.Bin034]